MEKLKQTILPSFKDLRRLADIDGSHLQTPQGEIAEEILDICPVQFHWCCRVIMERSSRGSLKPFIIELGYPGNVDVGLDERIEQALMIY